MGNLYTITPFNSVSASTTLTNAYSVVEVTTAGVTITLPTPIDNKGKEFTVKNVSSGNITVDVGGVGGVIDAESTQTVGSYDALRCISNGLKDYLIV